ncbi:DUF1667 domain-containing protein [Ruminococcaceae bacterium OttesenSCG-928-A16]|nr:DUF1667 domain-containing protein [Ruminococcaceae bacterium OttesenSCG-928-A16]
MKELICIVCPKGCHLKIDEENGFAVTGNACEKGPVYAVKELTNPTRVVTSTVRIQGAEIPRMPVKTDGDIPKDKIFAAMQLLNGVTLQAPVRVGTVIVPNILGTGKNFVATRSLGKIE